jgi:Uma2 family endonuclease
MSKVITRTAQQSTASAAPDTLRMSYEEFLKWEHPGIAEWVNGEVIQMSVKNEHQRVVDFLNQLIGLFLAIFNLGEIRSAPFVMRARPDGAGREPDLMVVTSEHLNRITSDQLDGPADLVIEVISDESVTRDKIEKFDEYEDAGVREYWIIDPRANRQRAEFFVLDEARRRFRPVPIEDDNTYHSAVLQGFWLNVDWLWELKPNVFAALIRIVGKDRLIDMLQ